MNQSTQTVAKARERLDALDAAMATITAAFGDLHDQIMHDTGMHPDIPLVSCNYGYPEGTDANAVTLQPWEVVMLLSVWRDLYAERELGYLEAMRCAAMHCERDS